MKDRLHNLLDSWLMVNATSPEEKQRGLLAAVFISGPLVVALVITVINLAEWIAAPTPRRAFYVAADILVALPLFGLWRLNRSGRTRWASYVYLFFLTLAGSAAFPAKNLDRVFIFYAIPTLTASFLIGPGGSFVLALFSGLVYSLVYFAGDRVTSYNYLSVLALLVVAFVVWLVASRLEKRAAERKQAEEALREAEVKYRALVEQSPAVVYTDAIDETSSTLYISPQVEAMSGYSPEEWKAVPELWLRLLHPDDRLRVLAENAHTNATGEPFKSEYRLVARDGRVVWVHDEAMVMRDGAGRPRCWQGVMLDITERRRAEAALRESEEKYHALFEDAILGIFRSTPTGTYLDVNPAFVRMYGYDSPDEMKQAVTDIQRQLYARPQDRDTIKHLLSTVGEIRNFEAENRRRDGHSIWISINAKAIRNDAGEILGYEGTVEDITERKRAEETLAQERNLLRTLIDNLPDHIFVKDAERRYILNNVAHLRSLGAATADEVMGKTVFDFHPREMAEQYDADERQVIQTGHLLLNREEQFLDQATGQERWGLAIKAPLKDSLGQIVGLVGIGHDITERKQAEEALRRYADENVRLYEEARAHSEQLELLYDAGLALNRVLEPRTQLKLLFEIMMKALRADRAEFFRYDAARGEMQFEFGVGFSGSTHQLRQLRFQIGEERGVVGRVGQDRALLYIPDVSSDPDWVVIDPAIRCGLWVPVEYEAQLRGVLSVLSLRPNAFTPQDQRLFTLFANQAAIALENAQLFEAAHRRAQRLATLNEIGRAVTSTLDLDGVLSTLLERVRQTTEAEACSVALIEPETGDLVFHQAAGSSAQAEAASRTVIGFRLKPGQGIAGWVATHRQSVLVPEAASDPRFHGDVARQTGFVTRSMVCVPIVAREAVVGVIQLINRQTGTFGAEDVELLEAVAAQAAIAIENARLFEAERAGRQRLETLYRIGQALNSTLDARAIFDQLTDEAMRATGATHGSALIARLDRNCFERRSLRGYSPQVAERARAQPLPLEGGLNGRAFRARQVICVDDVRTDPDYFPLVPETRSELVAPILRDNQVLGNLDLQSPQVGAFRDVDLGFLQTLTDQVAIALENAQLYQDMRRRMEELALVSYVALVGAAGRPFDETVARATEALSRLWPDASVIEFLFLDEAEQVLRLHPAYRASFAKPVSTTFPVSQGLTGWAARERQPIRVGDVTVDPRYSGRAGIRSEMVAPLVVGERVIGVINVESPQPDAFSGDDLRVLATLAGQFATILEKARLDAALEAERASLARRVAERTAELSLANAELAKAARLKDEFLAAMSHELRTPLNAVLGMSEALQEQVYGPLNEKQLKSLRTIEDSGRHLLALINDILDLSKIEAGKVELQIGPASIGPVCQASLQFVKQTALKKQIQVSSTLDSQVTTLQADERRLKQILVNLLSNAVKFTPEGGAMGLEVKGDAEKSVVHFTVWDTGIGIALEDMARLFKPFVQLDSRLSRQYSGTGLGLSLVQRMAELHGGSVSVESEVGKGSRFTVSLPWPETSIQVDKEQVDKKGEELGHLVTLSPSHPVTVLVADDNEISLSMMSEYLGLKGYQVIPARDGREVIQRAQEDRPDIILMDIQMPGMDGLEAIRRIRADAASDVAKVPIIALTALVMPGDRERCFEAGANEYISKPVSPKGLVEAIQTQLFKGD